MWSYMLTGLSMGARLILYDGSPFYPDLKEFLEFISNQGFVLMRIWNLLAHRLFSVTILGTSPRFLAEVQGRGITPRRSEVIP